MRSTCLSFENNEVGKWVRRVVRQISDYKECADSAGIGRYLRSTDWGHGSARLRKPPVATGAAGRDTGGFGRFYWRPSIRGDGPGAAIHEDRAYLPTVRHSFTFVPSRSSYSVHHQTGKN